MKVSELKPTRTFTAWFEQVQRAVIPNKRVQFGCVDLLVKTPTVPQGHKQRVISYDNKEGEKSPHLRGNFLGEPRGGSQPSDGPEL